MNKLRLALRERTQVAHHKLDGQFGGLELKRREDYATFLAAQAAVLPGLEAALTAAAAETVVPEWHDRLRAAALIEDLTRLGHPVPALEPGIGEWIVDVPSIIGAAYVIEGSRLGGQMLRKVVAASEDPVTAGATAFLGHGEGRRFWPSFDALLGATELSDAEIDTMIDSAVRSFGAFDTAARRTLRVLTPA